MQAHPTVVDARFVGLLGWTFPRRLACGLASAGIARSFLQEALSAEIVASTASTEGVLPDDPATWADGFRAGVFAAFAVVAVVLLAAVALSASGVV